jgi:hypothetical protein
MSYALSHGPRGRALAIGVTFGAMLLGWFGIAEPLLDWYGNRVALLQQRTMLAARMEAVAETVPTLKQQVSALGEGAFAPIPRASAVLTGANDAVAGAALQTRLGELASGAGATLASVETLPTTDAAGFKRISLRLTLNAPWASLVQFLAAIEHASPKMTIDDIQLRVTTFYGQAPGRGPQPIQASLTVAAFRSADAAARPGGP